MQSVDGSAVTQVISLGAGQAFSRARFIPLAEADDDAIKAARKTLMAYLSPVVARAKERREREYRVHTTVGFTRNYDVIVTGVIVAEDDDEI